MLLEIEWSDKTSMMTEKQKSEGHEKSSHTGIWENTGVCSRQINNCKDPEGGAEFVCSRSSQRTGGAGAQ